MRLSDVYNMEDSYVAVSFHRPSEARKHEEHLFPFDATYYLEKRISSTDSEDSQHEIVPVFNETKPNLQAVVSQ